VEVHHRHYDHRYSEGVEAVRHLHGKRLVVVWERAKERNGSDRRYSEGEAGFEGVSLVVPGNEEEADWRVGQDSWVWCPDSGN